VTQNTVPVSDNLDLHSYQGEQTLRHSSVLCDPLCQVMLRSVEDGFPGRAVGRGGVA